MIDQINTKIMADVFLDTGKHLFIKGPFYSPQKGLSLTKKSSRDF